MNNRIKELRCAAGLTLEELAKDAGTTHQQINRLETGQRKLTQGWMERIGKALGVPPVALIAPDPQPDQDSVKGAEEARWLQIWREMEVEDREAAAALLERMLVPKDKGGDVSGEKAAGTEITKHDDRPDHHVSPRKPSRSITGL